MSTGCVTDAELVALARQGDHEAFGELVTRHQAAVYRAALAAVGSPPEAEDAAQDAFVSAYRRLGSFRGDASFKTWLLTIAWNHAINRRRRLRRGQEGLVGQAGREGEARSDLARDWGPSPEQVAMDAQLRRDIAAEIRALSPMTEEPAPAGPRLVRTGISENLSVNLDDGKPLVVAQSADPVSDRQVTVECGRRS